MQPCFKQRKRLALLALESVRVSRESNAELWSAPGEGASYPAAGRDPLLGEHLARCEGCRLYWEEISGVAGRLASVGAKAEVEASEDFHRRVAERLAAAKPGYFTERLAVWFRPALLHWRVALPVVAALALVILVVTSQSPRPTPPPAPVATRVSPVSDPDADLPPTLAGYEAAANQSLEKLDELLTRQGTRSLPPAPAFTALELAPGRGSF